MADIAKRLPVILSTGDKLRPAQATAAAAAIGALFQRGSVGGDVGQAPKALIGAARDLARAQADDGTALETGSPATAVSRWIEAFINPASPTALEGADRLWTTALAHQRDLDRRRRHQSDGVGPVKLALSAIYGRMLADLQEGTAAKSTDEIVEELINTAHKAKMKRAQRAMPVTQQLLLLDEARKPKR